MKKKRYLSVIMLTVLMFSLICTSCGETKKKYNVRSFDYFDTVTVVTGYERNRRTFDSVSGEIFAVLGEYHRLFDIYNRYDGVHNLCEVNSLVDGIHPMVSVDKRVIEMLSYAKEMHELTGGAINVMLGSVTKIWHSYREAWLRDPSSAALPPMETLTAAATHTDIGSLIIDTEASTVWLSDPEATLDVGAIAKGYAVEMAAKALSERGYTGYIINVGGNVRTVGGKPSGKSIGSEKNTEEDWVVGIEDPSESVAGGYIAYLNVSDMSVVTSGSYQRYYTVGDKKYHHIIDPDTLMPAEGYLSVSVVCKSSAMGDALSTALFCMSFEDGLALVESLPDVEAIWVKADGTECVSSGFNSYRSAG